MKSPMIALSLIAFVLSASAFAEREIACSVPKGARTIDGIVSLHCREATGLVAVGRNTGASAAKPALRTERGLSWGERENRDRGANYSVEDTIELLKSREGNVSRFAIADVRRTLSGPNCDGWHMCEETFTVLESAPVNCTDSDDAVPPSRPRAPGCDPTKPYDCD